MLRVGPVRGLPQTSYLILTHTHKIMIIGPILQLRKLRLEAVVTQPHLVGTGVKSRPACILSSETSWRNRNDTINSQGKIAWLPRGQSAVPWGRRPCPGTHRPLLSTGMGCGGQPGLWIPVEGAAAKAPDLGGAGQEKHGLSWNQGPLSGWEGQGEPELQSREGWTPCQARGSAPTSVTRGPWS